MLGATVDRQHTHEVAGAEFDSRIEGTRSRLTARFRDTSCDVAITSGGGVGFGQVECVEFEFKVI